MKHFKEEKIVSAVKQIILNSFLVTLFFFSDIIAQIPINGFCRYREFSVKKNFTNIFPVDYNSDGYRDLLIYNSINNKYISALSDKKSNLINLSEKYSPIAISNIHSFSNGSSEKKFIFLSRRTRQIGVASFSRSGMISTQSKIKLNGFPSNIDVGDVDGDGKPEGLVSGTSLSGLSIIKEKNRSLYETRIKTGKVFLASTFIDLDYDSFPDIAAVDLYSNSVLLFYNNGSGSFTESRSIGLGDEISEFKTADFNSDGFNDLVYIKNNHFEVLLGDSVSSFQKKFILETPVKPDKYAILDFNRDGYNDIAFINTQSGTLYILFAKSTNVFYPPIIYLQKNGLADLTAYIDRTGKKLALISTEGKIYLINNPGIDNDSFSISLGLKPTALTTFDYLNDKFKDVCFIDETEKALKLILSERRNLFRTYFSIPLLSDYTDMVVDESKSRIKTFYCYSNRRTIEIIRMNFDDHNYKKQTLYVDGLLEDFKVISDRLKDRQNIYALIKKNNKTFLQEFEFRDFRLVSSQANLISSNVERSWLTFGVYKDVYSIEKKENQINLVKTVFDKKIIDQRSILSFNLNERDKFNYTIICLNELIGRARPVTFWITNNNNSSLYTFSNSKMNKYPLKIFIDKNVTTEYNISGDGDKLSFYFYNANGKLRGVSFTAEKKSPIEKDLFVSKNINNYLVAVLNNKKTFLIYSNNLVNTITFEKIK
ncbi:MAG: VCBS repeat-containing protein [Ignavibacteriales bacterium]|nr:VCBS repeat-containing protein [Ignavibacteriales bacterium]